MAEKSDVASQMAGISLADNSLPNPVPAGEGSGDQAMEVEGQAPQRDPGVPGVTAGEAVVRHTGTLEGHKDSVTSLHMGGEMASRLVSGSEDGTARVWDLEKRRAIRCFTSSKDAASQEVMSVVSGASGLKDVVAVGRGHSVALFDLREAAVVSSKAAYTFAAHQDEVSEVTMDCENGLVAAADDAGSVLVYDVRSNKILRRMENCHSNICSSVRFRAGHRWQLLSGGLDGKVVHWSFNKIKALHSIVLTPLQQKAQQLVNPRFVYAMDAAGADGVAVGLGDGTVALVDAQRGARAWEVEAFPNMVSAVAFAAFAAPAHHYLLAGGSDAHVLVTRVPPQACLPAPTAASTVAALEAEEGLPIDEAGGCRRVLSLRCSSQVNAVASTPQGMVMVGDQGKSILTFDLGAAA